MSAEFSREAPQADADSHDLTKAAWLALAAAAAILAGYHQTAWSIVSIWERSQTFAHGFLILPISAYLIWSQRRQLASLQHRPNPLVLPVLGLLGFGWLLATLAGVQVFEQYFLVAMIPVSVWVILGNRVAWAIAFPLAYLLLAVPFGDIFIPPLIEFTADFTVKALQLTGIPVYREGSFFTIPSGNWSVVEACSGVRYLIASFTLGTLYAYLTYHSLKRRLLFIAFSVIVPIVANGFRAYMIVMIGHLSDMHLAVGVDHLIYGWIFFGFVMLLLFWAGSFWREDNAATDRQPDLAAAPGNDTSLKGSALAAVVCIAVAYIWPVYAAYLENQAIPGGIPRLDVPGMPGKWAISANPVSDWKPNYVGAHAQFLQNYRNAGHDVSLYITYYRNQRQGAELINSENVLVPENNPHWHDLKADRPDVSLGSRQMAINQNQLHSSSTKLLVWRWYWLGEETTANPYLAKAILARNKLLGGSDDGAEILIATRYEEKPEEAVPVLQDFFNDMMPAITQGLHDASGR